MQVFYRRVLGRITQLDVQLPGQSVTEFVNFITHTPHGPLRSWVWANGQRSHRVFDTEGRLTQNEVATYGYDGAGRLTRITQNLIGQYQASNFSGSYATPITWTAEYDNRNRLTSFTRAGAETRYRYDANSNRLSAIDTISGASDFDAVLDGASRTQLAEQVLNLDAASNKLLGFTQTTTTLQNGKTRTVVTTPIRYQLDANGALTSDGLRSFEHDEARRLSKVRILRNGEAASIQYLHNALGQRVFKSDAQAEQTLPNEDELGQDFITWLRKSFGWLFTQGNNPQTSLGQAFIHADGQIPEWALLGEYDNGSANTKGRAEYIWLPTEDGSAIPVGLARAGKLYAVHTDHLGTPRQMTDEGGATVWQWPYSAFGQNKPMGMLALTLGANGETQLKGTKPAVELNLRYPGQYFDSETELNYNYFRNYDARMGRYVQSDPIGLDGGLNRFGYVDGNPLSNIDPSGLVSCKWVGIALVCDFNTPPLYDPKTDNFTPAPPAWTLPSLPDWSNPTANLDYPAKPGTKGTVRCNCKCFANTQAGGPSETSAEGSGEGRSHGEAQRDAEKEAKRKLGCQAEHCQCACINSKGEKFKTGGR